MHCPLPFSTPIARNDHNSGGDMTRPTRAIRPGLVLLALALLVAGCGGGGNKSSNTSKSTTTAQTTTGSNLAAPTKRHKTKPRTGPKPAPSASSKAVPRGGLVVRTRSATTNLYPLLGGSLTSYASGQVEGNAVKVLSIAGPEAFWVGKGPNQRLLVHIRLKGQ